MTHAASSTNCFSAGQFSAGDDAPQDLVCALYVSYAEGRSRHEDDPLERARQAWWSSLQSYTRSRLTPAEHKIAAACKHYCTKATAAAHHLDTTTACQLFGIAREHSERDELGPEARLLCKSELAAAESYLDLACRDFDQARRRVLQSMAFDEHLENRFGHKLLHVHRIHLLVKLVKMKARTAGVPQAVALAGRVLDYIHGFDGEAPPVEGSWGPEYLTHLPPAVLQLLGRQITVEIAAALADEQPRVIRDSLLPIAENPAFWERRDQWDPLSHDWIVLKLLLTECDQVPDYLKRSAAFLHRGPQDVALWYLTALDAARACRHMSSRYAALLCQELAGDLMKVDSIPASLRKSWARSLA